MKITALEVDGFGVWNGLKLEGLGDELNVLYGPNEAGKTTLLQFVRSVLYGFSPPRRKYLPPVHGGPAGGSVDMTTASGRFHLERHLENGNEQIALSAADGTRHGEHLVKALLAEVDEAIFNNVFAVGLREMQELGTLGGTEAAELLYNLTAGLDRISLVEVMRELENSRNSILDPDGGTCRMTQLIADREKLREEIEELGKLTRRYTRLANEQNQLQREINRLEQERDRTEHQGCVTELAVNLRTRWAQRAELDDQLSSSEHPQDVPQGTIERLDEINERIEKHIERSRQRESQRKQLKREAVGLEINQTLWRQAARIEALGEQESWLSGLEAQVAELEEERADLQSALDAEHQRMGFNGNEHPAELPAVAPRRLSSLRSPARSMKDCRRRVEEAGQQAARADEDAQSLAGQIEAAISGKAISGKGGGDLASLMESAADRVTQLRRRLQIDERLDQLTRHHQQQEEQSLELLDRQILPGWVLAAFAAVFALGFMLVIVGLFMPASITGSLGWALALLGMVGCGGGIAGKVLLERSNERHSATCQKQLAMLKLQIEQAGKERDALDAQLPSGGGPISIRLATAEQELAALEELVPLDTRRTAALQESRAAVARAEDARRDLSTARRGWSEALSAIGLPSKLSPKQVKQLATRCDQVADLQRRLGRNREELDHRRRELDSLLGRISQLATDAGLEVQGMTPLEQLARLVEALDQQEARTKQRDLLRLQLRKIRRNQAQHEEAASRLKLRRRELLRECGVENEQQLRQHAVQCARVEVFQRQRDTIAREIEAAIGGRCSEKAVDEQLQSCAADKLEKCWEELAERSDALRAQLRQRFERRGRLAEQLAALAGDRRMAGKQLEMAMLDKRIDEAAQRWQMLAVTSLVLERIRTIYEQQRQPETLKEASSYLNDLTRGRYRRVWTPLGEDVLRLDDAEGNVLAVEALSRGTREQLFLSLRLALAASYARRGAALPLVLDDVLVNFDADRAKAAAAVLQDFAARGHQLLVFTCHEHILKLFKSLKVPVNRLPSNAESGELTVVFEQPKRKATKPRKIAAIAPPADVKAKEPPEEEPSAAPAFELAEDDPPWDEEEDEVDSHDAEEDGEEDIEEDVEEYDDEEDEDVEYEEEEDFDDDDEEDEYEEEEYDDEAEAA